MVGRGGATARLVVLCGLLLGLFLMHGSPASAASGCHEAMTAAAGGMAAAEDHGDRGAPTGAVEASAERMAGHGPGVSCLSTQARGGVPLAGPMAVPVDVAVSTPDAAPPVAGRAADGCRAPPGGRALLIQVCVART